MKKNRTGTKKISCVLFYFFLDFCRKSDTEYNLEGKMAAENMASVYFLSTFAGKNTGNIEYLKEILKYRGVFYLLNIICGFRFLVRRLLL